VDFEEDEEAVPEPEEPMVLAREAAAPQLGLF
jgi:hypothetical protein